MIKFRQRRISLWLRLNNLFGRGILPQRESEQSDDGGQGQILNADEADRDDEANSEDDGEDFSDGEVGFGEDADQVSPPVQDEPVNPEPNQPAGKDRPQVDQAEGKAADIAKDQAKRALEDKAKREGAKKGIGLLLKNPYVLAAIAIIAVVIIVAIILFAVFMRMSNSGASGATQPQPTNPISDAGWVKQAALLSGDQALKKDIASDSFVDLKNNLTQISKDTTDTDKKKIVDDLINKLSQYQAAPSIALKNEILASLENFFDVLDNPMPVFSGTGKAPLQNIIGYNSVPFNETVGNENKITTDGSAPYFQTKDSPPDAIDIYTDKASPVYSPIPGTVTSVSDDGLGNSKIVIANGDWEILIAHITTTLKVGDAVTTDSIGTTAEINGQYLIQLDVAYCGRCVTSTKYDYYLWQKDLSVDYGSFLWKHIKRVLKIG